MKCDETVEMVKKLRLLEKNHKPSSNVSVKMEDISTLCYLVENAVPSIMLLQARLERGEYLAKQDGKWHVFDSKGEGVTSGKILRDILLNLIWMDC